VGTASCLGVFVFVDACKGLLRTMKMRGCATHTHTPLTMAGVCAGRTLEEAKPTARRALLILVGTMADSSEVTLQFIETTGAAPNVAKFFIER